MMKFMEKQKYATRCDLLLFTVISNIENLSDVDFPPGYGSTEPPLPILSLPVNREYNICPFGLNEAAQTQCSELQRMAYTEPAYG